MAFNGVQVPAAGVSGGPATVEFVPPSMPAGAGSNDTGPAVTPSGTHVSTSPQAVFTQVGALADTPPSGQPAPNIHTSSE